MNNTIFGNDGDYSSFPDPVAEPNDTIGSAIDTRQGRQHNPNIYQAATQLGDGTSFRVDASLDVDFYQFELEIGDHVLVDIDAIKINTGLDPVLRLFNSVGEQLQMSVGDLVQNRDPAIDFTATAPGTYYVGVSGRGNETYSAISLSGRNSASHDRRLYDPRERARTAQLRDHRARCHDLYRRHDVPDSGRHRGDRDIRVRQRRRRDAGQHRHTVRSDGHR